MEHTTIAVDLAKSVFQVAVPHRAGHVVLERRLTRGQVLRFFAQQPAATVLLEACGSSHHWARELQKHNDEINAVVESFRDWAFPEAWPKPRAPRRPSAQTPQP